MQGYSPLFERNDLEAQRPLIELTGLLNIIDSQYHMVDAIDFHVCPNGLPDCAPQVSWQ
jgi:hypothetical protein